MGSTFQTSLPIASPLMSKLASDEEVTISEATTRPVLFGCPSTAKTKVGARGTDHWLKARPKADVEAAFLTSQLPLDGSLEPHVGNLSATGAVRHLLLVVTLSAPWCSCP